MNAHIVGGPLDVFLLEESVERARAITAALRTSPVRIRLTWMRNADDARDFLLHRGPYVHAPRPDVILYDLPADSPVVDEIEAIPELRKVLRQNLEGSSGEQLAIEMVDRAAAVATRNRVNSVARKITKLAC